MDTPKRSADAIKKIAIITALYSAYMIISNIANVVQGYFDFNDNPLIPKYLIKYIAFPLIFIVPVFGVIGFLSFRASRSTEPKSIVVISCLIFAMLYFLFQVQIYSYIQSINPYGS